MGLEALGTIQSRVESRGKIDFGAKSARTQQRLPAVAVAIRPVGDRPPSTEEIRQIYQALQPALLRVGASVAERRDVADFVMTVSFTPPAGSSGSRVTVVGI